MVKDKKQPHHSQSAKYARISEQNLLDQQSPISNNKMNMTDQELEELLSYQAARMQQHPIIRDALDNNN